MKRYMIDFKVDLKAIDNTQISAMTPCTTLTNVTKKANAISWALKNVNPVSLVLMSIKSARKTVKRVQYENTFHIKTVDELRRYKNCISDVWSYDTVYVEHPLISYALIPEQEYREYILLEMMADIAGYVIEAMPLKKFAIALVNTTKAGVGASIPIEKVVVEAKEKCSISKEYNLILEDVAKSDEKANHPWISKFPNVKVAVDKGVRHMDTMAKTTINLGMDLGLEKIAGIQLSGEKEYTFYIYYEAEKI